MFWKNYKTIIGAVVGITPVILNSFGITLPSNVALDFAGVAIFIVGLMAKDFNK
jgi:uncharacterized membrane protein